MSYALLSEDIWELLIRAQDPDFEAKLSWVDSLKYNMLDEHEKPGVRLDVTRAFIEREREWDDLQDGHSG